MKSKNFTNSLFCTLSLVVLGSIAGNLGSMLLTIQNPEISKETLIWVIKNSTFAYFYVLIFIGIVWASYYSFYKQRERK